MIRRMFRVVLALLLAAGPLALGPHDARAAEMLLRVGDTTIPIGTIVYGDAITAGGTLTIDGTVTGNAMAAGGSVHVAGHVGGNVRAVGGDVVLEATAVVGGTVQAQGGSVRIAPGAVVRQGTQGAPSPAIPPAQPTPIPQIPFSPSQPFPMPSPHPGPPIWLLPPTLWGIVGAWKLLAGLAALIVLLAFAATTWVTAALLPGVTAAVADVLERSPGPSVLAGVVIWLLLGPVIVVLFLTVAGVLLVLLLVSALLIAIQLGISAVAVLIGRRVRPGRVPVEALVGAVLLAIAFAVPHFGWLIGAAATTWGMGAVAVAIMERRQTRGTVPPPPPAPSTYRGPAPGRLI
jgi:hypothetical protein